MHTFLSPMFTLAIAVFLLSSVVRAWPTPDAKELIKTRSTIWRHNFKFVGCDSMPDFSPPRVDVVSLLELHIADAEKMAAEAYKQAERGNRYYDAFFGKLPSANAKPTDAMMKERFETLSRIRSTKSLYNDGYHVLRCDYAQSSDKRCNSWNSAPMMTNTRTHEIWACRSFFRGLKSLSRVVPPSSRMGLRTLDEHSPSGGSILHELTHSVFETVDMLMPNKVDTMYGHERTLRGAQEGNRGWSKSRINADNYRMFATAAYWSATKGVTWSIDPGRTHDEL